MGSEFGARKAAECRRGAGLRGTRVRRPTRCAAWFLHPPRRFANRRERRSIQQENSRCKSIACWKFTREERGWFRVKRCQGEEGAWREDRRGGRSRGVRRGGGDLVFRDEGGPWGRSCAVCPTR